MNHGFQLLQTLYVSAFGKYTKFKHRFDKAVQSGKFKKLNKRKQSSLVSRLKRLYERLKSLQTQLKLAGACAAFSVAISLTNPVSAQGTLGPFERNDAANPLPPPYFISHPRVALVDIDNDGDIDAFVGNADGNILFYRNDSPEGTVRRFVEIIGADNPLNGVNKGVHAAPAFADIDDDGDLDMLLGVDYPIYDNPTDGSTQYDFSKTFFFENTGSPSIPVFTERTGGSNPFNGIYGTKYGEAIPVFVDIDLDGDVDLFVGSSYTYISFPIYEGKPGVQYYENQGTTTTPNFVPASHPLVPSIQNLRDISLSFADYDADGDLDAIVGQRYSLYGIQTLRNDGASFTEMTGGSNPAGGFYAQFGSPAFGDLDGDGDLDLAVGNTNYNRNSIFFFENTGNFDLEQKNDLNLNPFGGVDVGYDASPSFVDIDNDGDLDAIIGSKYSSQSVSIYINNDGLFIADPDNPLIDIVDGSNVSPNFVDIDGDGDADLFHGGRSISFFRNAGTAANPEFEEDENLFPSFTSYNSYDLTIAFIDLDNDGDMDAFIANEDYNNRGISYFENTGSATSPEFTLGDTPAPFDEDDLFEYNPNVVAIDLDNDGDLDLAITETYYNGWYSDSDASRTRFFENMGDETFEEMNTPLIEELTPRSITSFADIDGDGDLDAFVGNGYSFDFYQDGRVFYYENTNPSPVTTVSQSSISVTINTPAILDPDLIIEDEDADDIVQATITISSFSPDNEELDFTPGNGVTGEFEDGVLTLTGKASIDDYQDILRSVTYQFTGNVTSARESSGRTGVPAAKTVTFVVRDTDFTNTIVSQVSVITLILDGEPGAKIVVYNAVSPGVSESLNDYMRITGLPTNNTVSIFNRWGDEVFKVSGYDNNNDSKRFEGKNDNGKDLPAGTYYYIIEADNKKINGYLSLKR